MSLCALRETGKSRLRDVALEVGITERAVQKIVRDLQNAGFLTVSKQGRCNRYRINRRKTLRHGLESHCTVGKLLALVAKPARAKGCGYGLQSDEVSEDKPPVVIEEATLGLPDPVTVAEKENDKERKKEKKRAIG